MTGAACAIGVLVASARLAFIRGINVGGSNKVPMAELRRVLTDAGFADVRTYIQSGNIVYAPPDGADDSAATLRAEGSAITAAIEETWGLNTPVMVRTAGDVTDIVARSPFADADPARAFLGFFDGDPPPMDDLSRYATADEQWELDDGVVHLHFPDGIGRSKLGAKLLAIASTPVTTRNLRTIAALLKIAGN